MKTTSHGHNFLVTQYGSLVDHLIVFPSIFFRGQRKNTHKEKTGVMGCSHPSKSNVYLSCVMWGDKSHLLQSLILCGCLCAHTPAFIFIMYWQNVVAKTLKATTSTERHSQHTKLLSTLRNCGRLELLNGSIKQRSGVQESLYHRGLASPPSRGKRLQNKWGSDKVIFYG